MKKSNIIKSGILNENPVFVMFLGTCPTLATTNSLTNAVGMSVAFAVVLMMTNTIIAAIRKIVPDQIRIPVYIVVIATAVKLCEMLLNAYALPVYESLGVFLALIVVNCIVLGRAESFAAKNGVIESILDGIGSGIGFTLALTFLGAVREILGNGSVFGISLVPENFQPALIFVLAPGGFITIGIILACLNIIKNKKPKKKGAK